MNELQIFSNEEFGEVRSIVIDDEPWFVGKDVAKALGYTDLNHSILDHVDEEDRNKGIGISLESFMINQHRLNNFIPYGQVRLDNHESKALQEKLGLYVSDEIITWACWHVIAGV